MPTRALLSLLLLLLAGASDSFSQSATITGTITDRSTREALSGAHVLIRGTGIGAASDLDGRYSIRGVPAGTHVLVFSYLGYERQEREVTVSAGQNLAVNVGLEWSGLQGGEVVITAQAMGQAQAINQQLSSNTITNIVSRDRIQELPDVNAAESIGRLPGVAIQRSGGEANKIAIRGLSPKFNSVTVNGVRVPSVDTQDRSVDLSLISSNMLDGIEVTKALTPDKDADAIGGSVDLRLRTAPDNLFADFQVLGGYTALQNTAGNYRIIGNISNRFLANRFGVILGFNTDQFDRSADQFSGSYELLADPRRENERFPTVTSLNLRENSLQRSRIGGNVLLDYRLPRGEIVWNAFYNFLGNEGYTRTNNISINSAEHKYSLSKYRGDASIFTTGLNTRQDFGWLYVDLGASWSSSMNRHPEDYFWDFMETGAFDGSNLEQIRFAPPENVPPLMRNNAQQTFFNYMNVRSSDTSENEGSIAGTVRMPFTFGQYLRGYVQGGGKYRMLNRKHDVEQLGTGLYYGGDQEKRNILADALPDLGLEQGMFRIPITFFQSDYNRASFLNGNFPLGYTMEAVNLLRVTDILRPLFNYENQGSLSNDYSGDEEYGAAYAMTEINVGPWITFMPGFRWERERTTYNAKFVRGAEDRQLIDGRPQISYRDTSATRRAEHFLPMIHLQIRPLDWINLRLAYTHSLSRPTFRQFAPITYVSQYGDWATAPNTQLRTARARNYDASLSFYRNRLGLLTISAFEKEITDLVWGVNFPLIQGQTILPEINLPGITGVPRIGTSLNNVFPATVRGLEFDWQTNFWYLPSFLKGLVLNVNYTILDSETKYPQFRRESVPIEPRPRRPPFTYDVVVDTFRVGRMPDQPSSIANVTLGYDYRGFSIRTSYLYQSDILRSLATHPANDQFTRDYYRFDISVKQRLPRNVQMMANFNNINNRADFNYQSAAGVFPTWIEYYGFTMDIGVRYTIK
jgi:TonB-dependent receptor